MDTYSTTEEGQFKEQTMDRLGGKRNLDNKRNEVSPKRMQELEKKYGDQNEGTRSDAIKSFWKWFAANADRLKALYLSNQFEGLSQQISHELDKVEPQLAWEIGPGKQEANLLTISSEGNPDIRPIAELMVQLAPHLPGWEFYSARPARPAPAVVRLPESSESFATDKGEFIPIEQPRRRASHLFDTITRC